MLPTLELFSLSVAFESVRFGFRLRHAGDRSLKHPTADLRASHHFSARRAAIDLADITL